MYIKYIVNYWPVCLYDDIHSKMKVIYFEQGLVARGGFVCRPTPNNHQMLQGPRDKGDCRLRVRRLDRDRKCEISAILVCVYM